jgi:predicted HTH transcriptional regulator
MNNNTDLIERILQFLKRSLHPIPQELNEVDWKELLSANTERIKEHVSAFANYPKGGFLVFGISNQGQIVGVKQAEANKILSKMGSIARDGVKPPVQIQHASFNYEDSSLLGVYIPESQEKPVRKKGKSIEYSYLRSGGQTRKMNDSELRIALMSSRSLRFEEFQSSLQSEISEKMQEHFDFTQIFSRLKRTAGDYTSQMEFLHSSKIVGRSGENYFPTNLGVICCARNLQSLPGYERFSVRLTQYRDSSKLHAIKDQFFTKGYTLCLDNIIEQIIQLLPVSEIIEKASRYETPVIPEVAIREVICNAVIHRDYSKTDSYITIDIFPDRIEVTNPGSLLPNITIDRLIDHPSSTRNEVLADFMRKLHFCEERGSGIDRMIQAMEMHGLPPIKFISSNDHFTAILYAPKDFSKMEKEERITAVYQHACLNLQTQKKTTNASIRERFKFTDDQITKATRLLSDAIEAKRIKVANPNSSNKDTHYLPYWA